MNVSHKNLTIVSDPTFDQVGYNKTNLSKFTVVENFSRKNRESGKWEVIGKTYYPVEVWGEKAVEASMLTKGDVISVEAETGADGIIWKAYTKDNSYTNKDGETVSQTVLVIMDFEKREFDNE